MKTLTVKITFQIPEYYADGAFEKTTAEDIHEALCRAYPLCDYDWIKVEDVRSGFACGDRVRSHITGVHGTVVGITKYSDGSYNVEVRYDGNKIECDMMPYELEHIK